MCESVLKYDDCVRLYDCAGQHIVSILHCGENSYDIATPDGKVLYCGVDKGLVDVFVNAFGGEPIDK